MKLLYLTCLLSFCYGILERRLVKGTPTTAKPWMVYLKHPGSFCGGILYTKSLVITAAHCNTYRITDWRAYVNIQSVKMISRHSEVHDIVLRVNHPNFKGFGSFDVSVWWLLSDSSEPTQVRLDGGIELKKRSLKVKVLGWGNTAQVTPEQIKSKMITYNNPDLLEVINISLVPDNLCQNKYQKKFVSDTMFCIGQSICGPGTGSGDSGGPVYRKYNNYIMLIGLVNFGGACGYRDYYDVNTKISNPSITNFINHYTMYFKPQYIRNGLINTRIIHYFDKPLPQPNQVNLQNTQFNKIHNFQRNSIDPKYMTPDKPFQLQTNKYFPNRSRQPGSKLF